jgi:hypothetical protein
VQSKTDIVMIFIHNTSFSKLLFPIVFGGSKAIHFSIEINNCYIQCYESIENSIISFRELSVIETVVKTY